MKNPLRDLRSADIIYYIRYKIQSLLHVYLFIASNKIKFESFSNFFRLRYGHEWYPVEKGPRTKVNF